VGEEFLVNEEELDRRLEAHLKAFSDNQSRRDYQFRQSLLSSDKTAIREICSLVITQQGYTRIETDKINANIIELYNRTSLIILILGVLLLNIVTIPLSRLVESWIRSWWN
jgi:hypothetical protein